MKFFGDRCEKGPENGPLLKLEEGQSSGAAVGGYCGSFWTNTNGNVGKSAKIIGGFLAFSSIGGLLGLAASGVLPKAGVHVTLILAALLVFCVVGKIYQEMFCPIPRPR